MQIPLTLHCSSCREPNTIGFDAEEPSLDFACACGHRNTEFADPRQPVNERLLRRALREIHEHRDMAVAVVLAATAFEAEAWRALQHGARRSAEPLLQQLEPVLAGHPELRTAAAELFPDSRPPRVDECLQGALLRPRDRILRHGEIRCGEQDALRALAWAVLGTRLLEIIAGERGAASQHAS